MRKVLLLVVSNINKLTVQACSKKNKVGGFGVRYKQVSPNQEKVVADCMICFH